MTKSDLLRDYPKNILLKRYLQDGGDIGAIIIRNGEVYIPTDYLYSTKNSLLKFIEAGPYVIVLNTRPLKFVSNDDISATYAESITDAAFYEKDEALIEAKNFEHSNVYDARELIINMKLTIPHFGHATIITE